MTDFGYNDGVSCVMEPVNCICLILVIDRSSAICA